MPEHDHGTYEAISFRRHRHDVLNELQLIRGYLQLGKPERALAVVDRTATWLQSLTRWQSLGDVGKKLVWEAATCPHLQLRQLHVDGDLSDGVLEPFCAWLHKLNDYAAEQGVHLELDGQLHPRGAEIRGYVEAPFALDETMASSFPQIAFTVVDNGNHTEMRG
ncbi:hypothetical protein AAC03nite_16030 [Alicyclobacillus acidoterrestris]|uniref:Spo0B domain-containing protein n=1 Tax=Alicyclobacillus suci TaxID=2816080 RepID=UPI001193E041|nr:Spo0B domain-containing protein [Alicyclobacillus suci]GEO25818.1 hypothetical protein AAC03nite_16030 [Alicyclobacillus acidoterrestris]